MSVATHSPITPARLHSESQHKQYSSLIAASAGSAMSGLAMSGQQFSTGGGGTSDTTGMMFQATDATGTSFTSPFGDLQLLPSELHTAFGQRIQDIGLAGIGGGGGGGGGGAAVSLSDDVVASDDDEEDTESGDAAALGSPLSPSNVPRPKGNGIQRRGSKASSAASSSQSVKSKAKVASPAHGATPHNDATPKASQSKSKPKGSTSVAGSDKVSASSNNKKALKPGSEVKGERDSVTGRRKIKIQFIEDDSRRHITFSKRKSGIMKKAYELSVLTGTQVLLLIVSQTGLVFTFTTPKLRPVVMETEGRELIQKCLSAPDDDAGDEDDDYAGEEPTGTGMDGTEGFDDDDDEADDGSDGGDEPDFEERVRSSKSRSPSKAPVAILRPGPTMTASGVTPKRSGGGTGDGGAAGRRSRAATISNATVRQQLNQVNSPEQAVTGLSVPSTPATPSTASRSRKRRRTAAEGVTAPAALSAALTGAAVPANAVTTNSSATGSVLPPPAAASLSLHHGALSAPGAMDPPPSMPHMSSHDYPREGIAPTQRLDHPHQSQPPPHIQQGQYYRSMTANPSFLLGPDGGIDPASTQGSGGGTVNTQFFFPPVDMNKQQSHNREVAQAAHRQLQQHSNHDFPHAHPGPHHLGGPGAGAPGMPTSSRMTSSPHISGGPSPSSNMGNAGYLSQPAQFQSFGQAYTGLQQQSGSDASGPMHGHQSSHSIATMSSLSHSPWSEPASLPPSSGSGHNGIDFHGAGLSGHTHPSFWAH
ncbi:unnamed protein product [Parajaminaea phylloscopi]